MENQIQNNYSSSTPNNLEASSDQSVQSVILANHDAVPSTPLSPSISSNSNLSKKFPTLFLFLIFTIGALLAGIEIGKNQSTEQASLVFDEQPLQMESSITLSPSPSQLVVTTTISPAASTSSASQSADLETYQNMAAGFSIKYPLGWRKVEADNWVGFGPKEIGEDIVWLVSFYKNSEKTTSQIKAEIGMQFADRSQTEKAITINGLEATEIITTTKSFPDWYSVTIIANGKDGFFVIGNGAQSDEAFNKMVSARTGKESNISFEDFYSSFRVY